MWLKLMILLQTVMMSSQNVISMAQGQFRGYMRDGYLSYTGIPYATVSNSSERFKSAGIAPTWSNIRDSKQSVCSPVSDAEDCLQLDVYVPRVEGTSWPVFLWVTGGSGSYKPGKLVKEGIIVVIVYHRQGPQGFLCLGEDTIPGNAGVHDVILALRWVRDNIVAFYGNPSKIVVGGQSFGAAIVDAIILSSSASGLFHGAILQSGTATSPWAFNYNAEERASSLIDILDRKPYLDPVKVLVQADIEKLMTSANKLPVPYLPFGLCSEKPFKKQERILLKAPHDLLRSKIMQVVPMIIGYNSNEAYVFLSTLREANISRRITGTPTFLLPNELKFLNDRERKQVARQIGTMYFKDNVTMAAVLAYHRDAYFSNHIHRSVQQYSSSVPVYYYQFSHTSNIGVQSEPGVEKVGAAHSDELGYLFSELDLKGEDGSVQRHLLKLWTNFIKHLNPTPLQSDVTWETVKSEHPRIMDIGSDLKMKDYPHAKITHMWDNLYERYYYKRYHIAH